MITNERKKPIKFDIPHGAYCTHPRMRSRAVKALVEGRIYEIRCPDCGLEWQSNEVHG